MQSMYHVICHYVTTNLWGSTESLCCIPETNTILQINYTSITKIEKKKNTGLTCPQWKLPQALVSPSIATGQEQDHVSVLIWSICSLILCWDFPTPAADYLDHMLSWPHWQPHKQTPCLPRATVLMKTMNYWCSAGARQGGSQPQGAEVIPPPVPWGKDTPSVHVGI